MTSIFTFISHAINFTAQALSPADRIYSVREFLGRDVSFTHVFVLGFFVCVVMVFIIFIAYHYFAEREKEKSKSRRGHRRY